MMHPKKLSAFVVLATICLGGSSVVAQGTGRQGPPPSAPAKAPALGPLDDPRLLKTVSLTLKDANINQAVEALSKAADVSLVVERPATLALRPVSVVIKDAKLRDVMDTLSELYGYRWRWRNNMFLLTIVPQKQDMEKFGEEAMKTVYDQVLTPEQRAKVDANGYIDGKDMTPGQQGILQGYLQDMLSMALSSNLSVGKVVIDKEKRTFSINMGDGNSGAKVKADATP